MASLKDTVISGSLRVTDTTYTNDLILGKTYTARYVLAAPTSNGVPSFRALTNADVGLGNVENTKLSTWTGTNTIKTVGTITTGTWNATVIGVAYGGTGVNSSSTAINKVFASPGSGSAGAPSFRTLVAADVPVITTASDTTNELYMLGVTSSATTTVKYNSGVKAKNGAVTATTYNGLTLTAASTGFTIAGGTTSKTLTVSNSYTLGAACSHGVADRTTVSSLTNVDTWAANTNLTTANLIANWDGRYQKTSNLSNLTYLNKHVNFPTITGGTGVTASDLGASANPRYRPASWKFNAGITPIDGDVVTVKKPSALHDYGTWLSLDNGTTWYPIVYANTSRLPDWFSNNYSITLRFDATGTCSVIGAIDTTNKVMLATNARSTVTGVWRLWTMYDSGNDLGIRVYNQTSGYNNDYPFLVSRTALSSQIGTNNSNGSATNTVYGVIWDSPNRGTHNKTPTVNINTGMVKFHSLTVSEGGITVQKGSVWAGTYATNTEQSAQYNIGVSSGAGQLYMYSAAAVAGNRGLYGKNATGTSKAYLTIDKDNNVTLNGTANTATAADLLNINNRAPIKGNNQLEFQQFSGSNSTGWKNANPINDWFHHIRMNHANSGGYFVDLAFCFHSEDNYIRRVVNGTDNGWKRLWTQGNSVTSAVWNDYAENRTAINAIPGQVLYELGDDTLVPTTERLQHFAGIASDTWGFSQGETDTAKTPIAVAGRVLAYPYRPRDQYKPGDVLCAAPGGTVDIMTRDEVIMYPDRIVGIVSCVPDYTEWGGGNGADRPPVNVDGRIWVKVY